MQSLSNNRIRPILKWAGGKYSILEQITPFLSDSCHNYIEPFLGGGALFFSLSSDFFSSSILNDINKEIISLYEVIRDTPDKLMEELALLENQYSESFYYDIRSKVLQNKIKAAARTVFLNKTGFNGLYRQNRKGLFNVPFGKRVKCPKLFDEQNILKASSHLKSSELCSTDFEEVIKKANKGDIVYCDPPYEPLSSTSSFNSYVGGGFSRDDQKRLLLACEEAVKKGAYVLVSNSSAPFILELYARWEIKEIFARRNINSKGTKRGKVPESLILLRK